MSHSPNKFGLQVTATSREAIETLDEALLIMLAYRDAEPTFQKIFALDPELFLAHVVLAMVRVMFMFVREDDAKHQHDYTAARAQLAKVTDRERKHFQALEALLQGNLRTAAQIYDDIAAEFPFDLWAVKLAHDAYFFLGDSVNIRDSVARVFPMWEREQSATKEFGFVLGMYAFGLEETNLYSRAETCGRRAVELEPTDAWGVHAVTHVLEMEGRIGEGAKFLRDTRPHWEPALLGVHLNWHHGLYFIELQQTREALEVWDRGMSGQTQALDLVDASSFLLRLEIAGVDVGDRWSEVTNAWKPLASHQLSVFNDLHAVMSAASSKNWEMAEQVLAGLRTLAQASQNNANLQQGVVAGRVGVPLAEAMSAFVKKDYARAYEAIHPVRHMIFEVGGSHAQRDLFQQVHFHSAVRAQKPLAWNLSCERLERRPRGILQWHYHIQLAEQKSLAEEAILSANTFAARLQTHRDASAKTT